MNDKMIQFLLKIMIEKEKFIKKLKTYHVETINCIHTFNHSTEMIVVLET